MVTIRKHYSVLLLGCVLALSGAGAWISGELVKQDADLWGGAGASTGLFARLCEATAPAGFNCAGAAKDPWGRIKVPIPLPSRDLTLGVHTVVVPVAFLGLAYFVFMGVWFAFIARPRLYGYRWHRVPLVAGLCGVAVSLLYLGVMALGVAPWCIWCLCVHAINFVMVFAVWRLCRKAQGSRGTEAAAPLSPGRLARITLTSWEATSVIAFSVILVAGLWAYRREHLAFRNELRSLMPYKRVVTSLQKDPAFLLREYNAQPQHEIPLRLGEPTGNDHPRLIVFTDFECHACYCNALVVQKQIAGAFKEQLTVLVRHYPLDNACNANVKNELHPNACQAAYAAEAARIQGGDKAFVRMCDLLFKNHKALGHKLYRDLAVQIGLDADRFQSDMKGEAVQRIVQSDIRLAEKLSVTGTPTMLLNGRHIPKLCQVPVFWEAFAETWVPSGQDRVGADSGRRDVLAATHAIANLRE